MTGSSDDVVVRALDAVLRDHGWSAATNPRRLRGALNDVLGVDADAHRAAVDALVVAVEEGVVTDLLAAGREGLDDALPRLVPRLREWGLADEPAAWAVRAWGRQLPATTAPPPGTHPQALAPTTLPPAGTAPEPGATELPPPGPQGPGSGSAPAAGHGVERDLPGRRRRLGGRPALVGVAVVAVLAGGVVAAMAWGGEDTGRSGSATSSTGSTEESEASDEPAVPADPGTVLAASEVRAPVLDERLAMAAPTGGVRIARLGEVETVGTGDEQRTAPAGGRLVAFKLADWGCASDTCRSWDDLGLRVSVDGTKQPLPGGDTADTFVVAVPDGARDVDLVLRGGGRTQTLSLLRAEPGAENIAVLARGGRVDKVGETFTLTERTSIAFDYDGVARDTVPRSVTVSRAELAWEVRGAHPASPARAFLKVTATYTIPYGPDAGEPFAFEVREMTFVDAAGTTHRARDLDPDPGGIDAVFEVPADLTRGTLVLGGDSYAVQSSAGPYTRTLTSMRVPLRFG